MTEVAVYGPLYFTAIIQFGLREGWYDTDKTTALYRWLVIEEGL